jgi:hypothetical protein
MPVGSGCQGSRTNSLLPALPTHAAAGVQRTRSIFRSGLSVVVRDPPATTVRPGLAPGPVGAKLGPGAAFGATGRCRALLRGGTLQPHSEHGAQEKVRQGVQVQRQRAARKSRTPNSPGPPTRRAQHRIPACQLRF